VKSSAIYTPRGKYRLLCVFDIAMFVLQEYAKGGNQKPKIEERQTIQWTKEKGQTTIRERTWQYQKHIVIDTSLPHMTD
jgi:hypothetical protein